MEAGSYKIMLNGRAAYAPCVQVCMNQVASTRITVNAIYIAYIKCLHPEDYLIKTMFDMLLYAIHS